MTREPLPLATIQESVLEFLRGRNDVAVFGAQAVNAYVDVPRMTQDVDLLSPRAAELAEELRAHLATRFHIAVRVRRLTGGLAYRLFQIRKPSNRHLVDLRLVPVLPQTRRIAGVRVTAPADLVAMKVIALHKRRGRPKSGSDWRDVALLLLKFPELKTSQGAVRAHLEAADVEPAIFDAWERLVSEELLPEQDDEF